MCWSAQADAVAGGVVACVGVGCLVRAHRAGRPERLPLAALPVVLGVHQLTEALVWLGADGALPAALAGAARTAWAAVALPLLPVLVPTAVWSAATGRRRRLLAGLSLVGAAVAVPLAAAVASHPVTATVHGHTLGYAVGIPHPAVLLTGYLLVTVGSLLASGDRLLRRLGLVIGTGAIVCALLWRLAFVSTWCALAAVASLLLLQWAGHSSDADADADPTAAERLGRPAP
ncbi:DUF6629 family protein [Streptomyces sp. NRRL S-350]|uniref:DUF6629 family protein n=1 Tax=Streptomyces sp. NRRL S-350 TaxID=1463902 RepID=UPI0004BFA77F|nr:DUF6629 family protein [Streptomyces sp. NRRL S-350]